MTAFYEAAKEYLELGFHPIACLPRAKKTWVEWKKFQSEPPTLKEMSGWWGNRPDANVALVFGRGTFAVDLDGEESEALLEAKGIKLPDDAPRSKTSSGYHVLLSSDGPVSDCAGLLGIVKPGSPHVDIKGIGYVVAPPSIHPSGQAYRWIIPPKLPLPRAPQALLDLIVEHTAQHGSVRSEKGENWVADALSQGVGEGLRDDTCTRLAGYFIGKNIDPETTKAILCETFARNSTPPFPAREIYKCVDSIDRRHIPNQPLIDATPLSTTLVEFMKDLDRPPERRVRTHLEGLNRKLDGGFSRGELIFLAARAGVGKTALSLQFAQSAATDGTKTLIVSHEMLTPALTRRMVAQSANVAASSIRQKSFSEMEKERLMSVVGRMSDLPVWITDRAQTFNDIYTLCEHLRDSAGLDFLIVDYLQRIHSKGNSKRRLQVEQTSNALKSLAQEFRIPVLCLSAVSRPAKGQSTKPTMESLRESGALEHDADIIILLDRVGRRLLNVAFNLCGTIAGLDNLFLPFFLHSLCFSLESQNPRSQSLIPCRCPLTTMGLTVSPTHPAKRPRSAQPHQPPATLPPRDRSPVAPRILALHQHICRGVFSSKSSAQRFSLN